MNRQISEEVLKTMSDVCERLNDSLIRVKDTCPENEFKEYREEVSKIMTELYYCIIRPIHDAYPELEPEALKDSRKPRTPD
ncbi:hypothetical protein SAMN05192549_11328 [Duganella sacchari]|uniref:Uncharacterized protein n=2 Tax=Duganella TaxID=75654 RepID=A0A1M7R6G7_9BURK|nr:hypothetical protein [Duganella sacchari]SHN41826.1 hypothetical protein SAMN05192549_11328 [Duganella sacchari]